MELRSEKIGKSFDPMDKRIALVMKADGSRIKYWFVVLILIFRCTMFMILSFQYSILLLLDLQWRKQNPDLQTKQGIIPME